MSLLKKEQEKNEKLQQELQEQIAKNTEYEMCLADIRNECRHPFVVPALLEAFMAVSKLTTSVTTMHSLSH